MKSKYFLIILLFISLPVIGEENRKALPKSLAIGYFGELITHPGLTVSLELPFYENGGNQLFITVRCGGYFHYLNHTALFVGSEFGYRYTFKNGLDIHTMIGVGYMHKFLGGTIYEVTDSGELVVVSDYDSPHFMPNLAFGFGYTFVKDSKNPINLYSRIEIFGEYPYNTYILPLLATSIGIRIHL